MDVSPRIQRITIRSWPYNFETQWIKGKLNVVTDALSRLSPTRIDDSEVEKLIKAVNILVIFSIQQKHKEQLQKATRQDEELQGLSRLISNGWPQRRSNLRRSLQTYWIFRDEKTAEDGILF